MVRNHFIGPDVARRYRVGRPAFHARVAELIARRAARRFAAALDVGCGTGMSTRPLAALADEVIGVDPSADMLAEARAEPAPGVAYAFASAEALPFPPARFDLLTAGSAFHWFDRDRFLAEARRVLAPDGWLALYDHWFTGALVEDDGFQRWAEGEYQARFPMPPRHPVALPGDEMAELGFAAVADESFDDPIAMDHPGAVRYLITQSNVIAAVAAGRERLADAEAWLGERTARFFAGGPRRLLFRCRLRCWARRA